MLGPESWFGIWNLESEKGFTIGGVSLELEACFGISGLVWNRIVSWFWNQRVVLELEGWFGIEVLVGLEPEGWRGGREGGRGGVVHPLSAELALHR